MSGAGIEFVCGGYSSFNGLEKMSVTDGQHKSEKGMKTERV